MIAFRSMTDDEYPAYFDYFVRDYADEIVANYRLTGADALTRAKQEITETLPEGVNTRGHVLLCLMAHREKADAHVGYLWYKPDTLMRTVFIYDFHIFPSCQGQGLGKASLLALEDALRDTGFKEIRLRVAADNARARHLYETAGFAVTGINMNKILVD